MQVVLSIAGSDSGAGAGIQADIKTAAYHNVFMTTAITALTAQNTKGVHAIQTIPPSFVKQQIKSILDDFEVKTIKIGMLGNVDLIKAVKEALLEVKIPIILDPVAISRSGSILLRSEALEELKTLFNNAYLLTPNRYEAKEFFNVESLDDVISCEDYGTNILFKNIITRENECIDILKSSNGELLHFKSKKADENNTHGSGCSYSSSIASLLAKGYELKDAISLSKEYIYQAINKSPNLGSQNGPINHSLKD